MFGVEMKWQAIEQTIDGAICMKVQEGTWVTLVYRTRELGGWTHWKMIPIDKTKPKFLASPLPAING